MFCFYRYGDRGALHSFPTRRSSDLVVAAVQAHVVEDTALARERDLVAVRPLDHADPGGEGQQVLELPPEDGRVGDRGLVQRSEEHTSELQSHSDLVCRLLLEKKNDS